MDPASERPSTSMLPWARPDTSMPTSTQHSTDDNAAVVCSARSLINAASLENVHIELDKPFSYWETPAHTSLALPPSPREAAAQKLISTIPEQAVAVVLPPAESNPNQAFEPASEPPVDDDESFVVDLDDMSVDSFKLNIDDGLELDLAIGSVSANALPSCSTFAP